MRTNVAASEPGGVVHLQSPWDLIDASGLVVPAYATGGCFRACKSRKNRRKSAKSVRDCKARVHFEKALRLKFCVECFFLFAFR